MHQYNNHYMVLEHRYLTRYTELYAGQWWNCPQDDGEQSRVTKLWNSMSV